MDKKISIIINNYNYGAFLEKAITSALTQTCLPHEVIVVDDGSSDSSRDIMRSYLQRIILVEKDNGGQASAFNAGYKVATGDWMWFLDSDDWLKNDAIETVQNIGKVNCSKIHGPLLAADEKGDLLHYNIPSNPLSQGNVISELIAYGGYSWPPTSGNVFPRWMLDRCMPIPEDKYRLCADLYICNWAAVLGSIEALQNPLGYYRIHSSNRFQGFKMNSKWLENQANNLITGASLTEELVKDHTDVNNFKYQFNRRSLEMLMITKRFSKSTITDRFSKRDLQDRWNGLKEVQGLTGLTRIKAKVFWSILAYAPSVIAQLVIAIGVQKNKKALQSKRRAK